MKDITTIWNTIMFKYLNRCFLHLHQCRQPKGCNAAEGVEKEKKSFCIVYDALLGTVIILMLLIRIYLTNSNNL